MYSSTSEYFSGIYFDEKIKKYQVFTEKNNSISRRESNIELQEIIHDSKIPLWILRHSLGKPGSTEDYSSIENYREISDRERELKVCLLPDGSLKNLEFSGLKLPISKDSYAHAVGPIHAGIIEPGHFRFFVTGEYIQFLHIRLGFQKRNVYQCLRGKSALEAIPIAEAIATDSTISYSWSFSEIFEQSAGLNVDENTELIRAILLEVERIAIHIGDMGAISGDIGYYPLQGLCSTDRGVPLGVMEALTGSRFGKGSIFPGEVRLNPKLKKKDLQTLIDNLKGALNRLDYQFERAASSATFRERLNDCGNINREQVMERGFVGMAARCTGVPRDYRLPRNIYKISGMSLNLLEHIEYLEGDAWSRFFLRYQEIRNSVDWVCRMLKNLDISSYSGKPLKIFGVNKFQPGIFHSAIEGWRGPVLVALELTSEGKIQHSYIKDPSVTNWHALELAVRGELIGDFPLNNKSFNLSYVGFDL